MSIEAMEHATVAAAFFAAGGVFGWVFRWGVKG